MDMNIVATKLDLKMQAGKNGLNNKVDSCYTSDLLSNVMGQAGENVLWITMQGHQNIVAIASLLSLAGIVVAGGASVEEDTITKAEENDIPLFTTDMPMFDVVGKLYVMGLKGFNK